MSPAAIPPSTFKFFARQMFGTSANIAEATVNRRYRAYFGTSPTTTLIVWFHLHHHDLLPKNGLPPHLLWGQLFLKMYATEEIHAGIAGVNETTFRLWSWLFIEAISKLESRTVSTIRFPHFGELLFLIPTFVSPDYLDKLIPTQTYDVFLFCFGGWDRL